MLLKPLAIGAFLLPACAALSADVVINEIMHHPQSENPAEEYIELLITDAGNFTTSIGDWRVASLTLTPGINRLFVQAFDENAVEIEQAFFDVWHDDGSVAGVSGALAANTTWTVAGEP